MKLLITGANGQLGRCLQDVLASTDYEWFALDRRELDIGDRDAVVQALSKFSPDVVINAAAYTAVDRAESDVESAYRVNEEGPGNLAVVCRDRDIRLIHVSTDYVFDGSAKHPYQEVDATAPLGVYGASKLAGENAVMEACESHLVIRVAWVFSEYGNNFLKTMLRLAAERDSLGVVGDQRGTPTYAGDLASALVQLATSKAGGGAFHFSGGRPVSWYEFAAAIFLEVKRQGKLTQVPRLNRITTEEFPTLAKRPASSVLDGGRLAEQFAIGAGDWEAALTHVIRQV